MNRRRVVVTGMGVVSPIGINVPSFYASLMNGRSGVSIITKFDASEHKCQVAAEIKDFDPNDFGIPRKVARTCDLYTQYALAAVQEAIDDSGLPLEKKTQEQLEDESLLSQRIENTFGKELRNAVIIGTGMGGVETILEQHNRLLKKGPKFVSPLLVPKAMINSASVTIALFYWGLNAYVGANSEACATGLFSLHQAYSMIKSGEIDFAIVGASDALINPLCVAGFERMGALTTDYNDKPENASRPFDLNRSGFVLSEGAAALILEEGEHAKERGFHPEIEILGFGITTDGYHISSPDKNAFGSTKAIELALKNARLTPEQIDYINAHGTSTLYNDKYETLAIKKALGDHAYRIPVSSTKSMHGHPIAPASLFEIIATILAIKHSKIPPTTNYETPDPDCDLDYVPNKPREKEVKCALKISSGFGGHNIVVAVRKYKEINTNLIN